MGGGAPPATGRPGTARLVTCREQGDLILPLRLLHPTLPAVGRSTSRKNLAKLKRRIEAGIPPLLGDDARYG